MKYFLPLVLGFIIANPSLFAQDFYGNIMDIPVTVNGKTLAFPFTGGLNNPQPNEIDLDDDGIDDLYIFDRAGNVSLTFINKGTANTPDYKYAPSYARYFPEEISNWVILRDYNDDGIMDLFTHAQKVEHVNGVMVYTGSYVDGRISFQRLGFDYTQDIIPITVLNGTQTQLYISNVDYPAIDDLDCDGDLDILTFNVAGGVIELYTNMSIEEGYGRDSLIFELTEDCWGGIFETSISPVVELSETPGDCADNFQDEEELFGVRHPGSTLLTLDGDNDGDKDLILGDITYTTINYLENGGACEQAWIVDQDAAFPSYDVSADVPVFPAAFYLDVNNDGAKDMLVSPNAVNASEDEDVILFYENVNTTEEPQFEYRQNNFLIEDMLDFGTGSNPAFFDYNADGLLDLVVGSDGYYEPFGDNDTRLFLFENTGTAQSPAFELVDDDYLMLSIFDAFYSFTPAFGDIDNDGDTDLLVGENSGKLFFAENTAGAGNIPSFAPWQYAYMDIDVGLFSSPWIVDLNRDGLSDIIVGEQIGNLNFFLNTGSAGAPQFNADSDIAPNIFALGNINLAIPPDLSGNGAPVVLDQEGTYILLAGMKDGNIRLYNGFEGAIDQDFTLNSAQLGGVDVGRRSHPAIADIDNDGKLEMIVGNERGGLEAFQTELRLDSTSPTEEADLSQEILVFPNPASDVLNIQFPYELEGQVMLFNSMGQLVVKENCKGVRHYLKIDGLAAGIYTVQILGNETVVAVAVPVVVK